MTSVATTGATPLRKLREVPKLGGGLPVLGQGLAFGKNPMAVLERGWRELGEVFEFVLAGRRTVFLAGPRAHEAYFRAPEDQLSAKEVYQFTIPIFGRNVAYDAPRDLMAEQVAFLHPALREERMRGYTRAMCDELALYTEAWGDTGELELPDATNEMTVNIASRCLLGPEIRERLQSGFAELYHDLQGGINTIGFFAPRLPTPKHRRRDRARRLVSELIGGILEERRRTGTRCDDMLQTLMEARYRGGRPVPDDEIVGILLTALFGGQHTSAVLAAWVGVELLQHHSILDRVVEEIRRVYADGGPITLARLKEQEELERAVREAERLHPPLTLLVRKVLRDFDVEGFRIPAGRLAMVSPGFAHRLPRVFADPHRYDPDRFAPPRSEDSRQPYSLITFGGGKHACIGMNFAYVQIKALWTYVLANYALELGSPAPAPDYGQWVTGPQAPCRARYQRRKEPLATFSEE
ncbi:MAG: cytochrome P450 [Proteobacteria bacterium]|nr:cytochrome P450 [Pseudomonadota bacterium]